MGPWQQPPSHPASGTLCSRALLHFSDARGPPVLCSLCHYSQTVSASSDSFHGSLSSLWFLPRLCSNFCDFGYHLSTTIPRSKSLILIPYRWEDRGRQGSQITSEESPGSSVQRVSVEKDPNLYQRPNNNNNKMMVIN